MAEAPKIRSKAVGLSGDLHDYVISVGTRVDPAIIKLQEETFKNSISKDRSRMCSPRDAAAFLGMITKLTGAKKVIEVGVFTGFTTLAFALSMPDDGIIYALDVSEDYASVGKPYWSEAKVDHKIKLTIGDAKESMAKIVEQEAGSVDIVFIDADKENYKTYYELGLKALRPGGVVLIDNVLWSGKVIDLTDKSPATEAIRALNKYVHDDNRVDISMIPLSDGLTIARKK